MPTVRLSKRVVDLARPGEKDFFLWDREMKGFGLKVSPAGRKTYVCQYRVGGGRRGICRRFTIGTHGSPWTIDRARVEARRILGAAANNEDPAAAKQDTRRAPTVAELCNHYLVGGCATKKASTLATDRGRIERHIKPLLGALKVASVTRADVRRFLQDVAAGKTAIDVKTGKRGRAIVRGGKGTATRTVGLLGGIFAYAVERGLIEDNPVRGVKRFPDRRNERFLSEKELGSLGQSLRTLETDGQNPYALAIIRLLVFTGARKGEIERLQWKEVDFDAGLLRLADSKTGPKAIVLNPPALNVLAGIIRIGDSPFVFPATKGNGHFKGMPKAWHKLRAMAQLLNLRLHDLRHSFASVAVAGGASFPVIGALLGHAHSATTQRYAHLSNDPLRSASRAVGHALEAALEGSNSRIPSELVHPRRFEKGSATIAQGKQVRRPHRKAGQ